LPIKRLKESVSNSILTLLSLSIADLASMIVVVLMAMHLLRAILDLLLL
jgi:hypothetical protein